MFHEHPEYLGLVGELRQAHERLAPFEHRAEASHRLADWLEGNGYPAHAEVIRNHLSRPESGPGGYHTGGGNFGHPTLWDVGAGIDGTHIMDLSLPVPPHREVTYTAILPEEQGRLLKDAVLSEGTEQLY